jgi:hypothetical protein
VGEGSGTIASAVVTSEDIGRDASSAGVAAAEVVSEPVAAVADAPAPVVEAAAETVAVASGGEGGGEATASGGGEASAGESAGEGEAASAKRSVATGGSEKDKNTTIIVENKPKSK